MNTVKTYANVKTLGRRTMRAQRLVVTLGVLALASFARTARATPDFPGVIQQDVGSADPPACTICHNTPLGGFGTVTTAFGVYMRSRGLVAGDEASLRSALAAARAEKHDSNGDAISDIDALKGGKDPNAVVGTEGEPPEAYGCIGRVATRGSGPSDAWLALPALAVLGLARRRRAPVRSRAPGSRAGSRAD